ncbi:efflux RND transporter periplasmic adaptor subunit [Coprobacter tertius]|uniref:Efflux RND transporter periplasmic adaptor subunit n=1 Tax=Coprobacter tertius TaxID=2944915 RepID=A0ABT1MG24_9BACT|nr:efflux RND transporter periplasmic adaptor subunit [Coprobacter tertius]MCP9611572.1 efflux RND transporter periplasmic adaptor subunit [Coprobacter tertius]
MKKIFFLCTLCAYILSGCNGENSHKDHEHANESELHEHEKDQESHEHEHENEKNEHSDEIILTKEKAYAAGVTVEEVIPKDFVQVIKTNGQILAAQGDESTIVATVPGVVSFGKTSVSEGASIKAGNPLLTISSKNLMDGDPVSKLKINYETALKDYNRAQSLVKEKIISEKEFNQIRQNYETARLNWEATSNRHDGNGTIVASPISGYIKNRLVNEGDFVSVGTPLLSVSQNRRLMLRADVSERHYSSLPTITSANFKTPYDAKVYELKNLNGRLVSYGKTSGENSFYVPIIFEFDNKGNIIAGSYVEIYLLSSPRKNSIIVPVTALTEEQGVNFVYIQLDEEGYKKQEVKTGNNNGKEIEILSGLKPGDRVVTQGAYQVKLASNSNVIPEGHSHNH